MPEKYLLLAAFLAAAAVVAVLINRAKMTAPTKETWLTGYRYAHRGLHGAGIPENSLAAARQAMENGYAIELDLQLTRDGHIVAFHDASLIRLTGTAGCIKSRTLAELQELRLQGTEECIPTLEEVLSLVDGKVPILFELKSLGFTGRLEKAFLAAIGAYAGLYAVQSFSPVSLCWFRLHAPHIVRGQLACDIRRYMAEMHAIQKFTLGVLLLALKRLEANFISRPNFISYEFHRLNSRLLKRLRRKGAPVFAWTIRSEEQFNNALPYTDAVIFEDFLPYP